MYYYKRFTSVLLITRFSPLQNEARNIEISSLMAHCNLTLIPTIRKIKGKGLKGKYNINTKENNYMFTISVAFASPITIDKLIVNRK